MSQDNVQLSNNRQVQHILATTFSSRCVVWDLRKNDPIIKVSDSTSRMRTKVVAWHPEVATQLCLASEDDHTPVIQMWDLRQASSPIKTLEGHQVFTNYNVDFVSNLRSSEQAEQIFRFQNCTTLSG